MSVAIQNGEKIHRPSLVYTKAMARMQNANRKMRRLCTATVPPATRKLFCLVSYPIIS